MLDTFRWYLASTIAAIVLGLRRVKNFRSFRRATAAPSAAPPTRDASQLMYHADPLAPIAPSTPSPFTNLRSQDSRHSVHLRFRNTLAEPLKIFWISYDGVEVRYKTIEAGKIHRQQTFATHPWTFATMSEPRQRLVVNDCPVYIHPPFSEEREAGEEVELPIIDIARPRPRLWTPEAHTRHFKSAFGEAVREVLLCHCRLRKETDSVNFGALPLALRDAIIALAAPTLPTYTLSFDTSPETHPLEAAAGGNRV